MSSFSDVDLSKISPQRKKRFQKGNISSSPTPLKIHDYKYPENSLNNGRRLKLPKLLAYQLPNDLLINYNISQLSLAELNSSLKTTITNPPSTSLPTSVQSKKNIVKESIPEPNSAPASRSGSQMGTVTVKVSNGERPQAIQELAEQLKKSAITFYVEKQYENSLLDFIQSYLLFIINFKTKENETKGMDENDSNYNKFLSRKRRDITTLLSFGEQMISNFNKVIRLLKQKNNNELIEMLLPLIGFIYYINGFIGIYLSALILKQINLLNRNIETNNNSKSDSDNNQQSNSSLLSNYIHKYEATLTDFKESFKNGEINFGLFKIMKLYPNLLEKSLTKMTQLKNNEIILMKPLNMPGSSKFKLGINYCLPICSHSWDLNNVINFGSLFLNEWCLKHSIRHKLIF